MKPDVIKSLTPIYLSTLGLLLAILAVVTPGISTELRFSVVALASGAFGGANGIAQQSRQQSIQGNQEVNVDSR